MPYDWHEGKKKIYKSIDDTRDCALPAPVLSIYYYYRSGKNVAQCKHLIFPEAAE